MEGREGGKGRKRREGKGKGGKGEGKGGREGDRLTLPYTKQYEDLLKRLCVC